LDGGRGREIGLYSGDRSLFSRRFSLNETLTRNLMGNLKKKRRLQMNKHKRKKRLKANRHKKRTWQK
jgi:hypothetical protein